MSFNSFFLQTADSVTEINASNTNSETGGGGAVPSSAGAKSSLGNPVMMVALLLMLLVMYFFMIRPQNKKQKEMEKKISALKKGDKVVTIGGIHGTIAQAKEKTLVVKVDDNTKIEFNRSAIATVISEEPSEAESSEKKAGLFSVKSDKKKVAEAVKETDGVKKDE